MMAGGVAAGTRLGTVARTVDLFPAVLELMRLGDGKSTGSGRSLVRSGLDTFLQRERASARKPSEASGLSAERLERP